MKKIILVLTVMMLAAAMLAGCTVTPAPVEDTASPEVTNSQAPADNTPEPADNTPVKVLTLKGPTGLGMLQLMEANEKGETSNKYEFTVCGSPDEIKTEILAGRYDVAAVPINLAAVLYNKTEGALRIAAVNTLGVLYVLENGDTIKSVAPRPSTFLTSY